MLTINSKSLLSALNLCKGGIKEATTTPKTRYYKFDAANNVLNISACNSEVSLQTSLPCECKSLQILIPADKILELLSKLPDQPITITVIGEDITVTTQSGVYDFPGDSINDFLQINTVSERSVTVSAEDLQAAVYSTEFARSTDEIQGAFIGLLVEFTPTSVSFTGCNLIMLSTYSFTGNFTLGQILLPPTIVSVLKSINKSGDVTLNYSDKSVSFEYDNVMVKSLLMDEKYANWRAIVPVNQTVISVNRSLLSGAIARILAFSAKATKQIYFSASGGIMSISGTDLGLKQKGSESIKIENGIEMKLSINGDMLLAALNHFGSENIKLVYQSNKIALIVKEPVDGDNFSMIFPMND